LPTHAWAGAEGGRERIDRAETCLDVAGCPVHKGGRKEEGSLAPQFYSPSGEKWEGKKGKNLRNDREIGEGGRRRRGKRSLKYFIVAKSGPAGRLKKESVAQCPCANIGHDQEWGGEKGKGGVLFLKITHPRPVGAKLRKKKRERDETCL